MSTPLLIAGSASAAALIHRVSPAGETTAETSQVVSTIAAQIDALAGRIGDDSAMLRTRLTSFASISGLVQLAPSSDDVAARADLLAPLPTQSHLAESRIAARSSPE